MPKVHWLNLFAKFSVTERMAVEIISLIIYLLTHLHSARNDVIFKLCPAKINVING